MELCAYANHTYVSTDSGVSLILWVITFINKFNHCLRFFKLEHLISVKDERMITGAIGSCIDKMLCRIDKRKCRIIGRLGLGLKLDNGTYTGILGKITSIF